MHSLRRAGQRTIGSACLIWIAIAAVLLSPSGNIDAERPTEYQVKALFLTRFAQFVQWPSAAFADRDAPVVIGLLGDDPFGRTLDRIVAGQTVQGRRLVVKRFAHHREVESCHVLFISSSEKKALGQILAALRGTAILTIGEAEEFIAQGGVIQFFIADEMVHFEINGEVAARSGLRISSRLLKLSRSARQVQSQKRR